MKKEMLINVLQPEECRIAILEDGVLEELYVERTGHESYVGNIYKGRIVNIEPSIQAAFVDFGVGRNGFLHVSDVEPAYYRHLEQRREQGGRRNGNFRDRDRDSGKDRGRRRPRPQGAQESEFERVDVEDVERTPPTDLPHTGEQFNADVLPFDDDLNPITPDATAPETPSLDVDTGEPLSDDQRQDSASARNDKHGRRRRGRGRGRGRPRPNDAAASPPQDDVRPSQQEPPLPMDSVEHRTHKESGGGSPSTSVYNLSDDDLTFSSAAPRTPEPSTPAPPESRTSYDEEPSEANGLTTEFRDEEPAPIAEDDFAADTEEFRAERDDDEREDLGEGRERDFDREEGEADARPRHRQGDRGDRGDGRDRRRGRRTFSRPVNMRPKPLIQDIFKRGQEVLVQVIKEGIGTKGPTLSTYISIAGRYLVLMPGLNRIGVSRKITDDDQRRRLRDILSELEPPRGLGFIIRTAGLDRTKKELQRDLAYLSRLWQVVVRRIKKIKAPAEIYQESDMIIRTIRDTFTSEIDTIWVDEAVAFSHAQEFLQIVMPRYASRIQCYSSPEPMFHKYGIEDEIGRIQRRHVPLAMGGSIVIDQTEALVAIDVNSGNFRADNNAEETAYQMNLQAAKEIARQLRLRDLGGVIVNDFIDMRDEKHRRGVEKALRDAIKRDRARTKILKISQFGIIEMTRQRIRPSLKRSVFQDCPHCTGTGQVKTTESMSIDVMRMLQLAAHRPNIQRIDIKVHRDVANYLQNRKRKAINQLEESGNTSVIILADPVGPPELLEFACFDNNNNEVKFRPVEEPPRPRRR